MLIIFFLAFLVYVFFVVRVCMYDAIIQLNLLENNKFGGTHKINGKRRRRRRRIKGKKLIFYSFLFFFFITPSSNQLDWLQYIDSTQVIIIQYIARQKKINGKQMHRFFCTCMQSYIYLQFLFWILAIHDKQRYTTIRSLTSCSKLGRHFF